jgi:hypothetical protein
MPGLIKYLYGLMYADDPTSIFSLFSSTEEIFFDEEYYLGTFMLVTWTFLANIVMINMLIAMMGNTYNIVASDVKGEHNLRWSQRVMEQWRTAPAWMKQTLLQALHKHTKVELLAGTDDQKNEEQSNLFLKNLVCEAMDHRLACHSKEMEEIYYNLHGGLGGHSESERAHYVNNIGMFD